MALALLVILFLFGIVASAGLHAMSDAIGFWPYMFVCFGGGSLMIGGVYVWERLTSAPADDAPPPEQR